MHSDAVLLSHPPYTLKSSLGLHIKGETCSGYFVLFKLMCFGKVWADACNLAFLHHVFMKSRLICELVLIY